MKRIWSVNDGRYFAVVTNVKEEQIGPENNIPVVKVYFRLTDNKNRLYDEKTICIFQRYDSSEENVSYKLMKLLDELEEDDIDCDRIREKAKDKKFVITIGEEKGYYNIVDIRLSKKRKQRVSTVEEE